MCASMSLADQLRSIGAVSWASLSRAMVCSSAMYELLMRSRSSVMVVGVSVTRGSFSIFDDGRRSTEDSSLSSFILRLPSNSWQMSQQELDRAPPGQLGGFGVVLGPIGLEEPVLRARVKMEGHFFAGSAQV